MFRNWSLALCLLWTAVACPTVPARAQSVDPSYRLELSAPIATWDEAIPLGNGMTGGLLWGEGRLVRLSLDRGDLWDLRTPEIYKEPGWNYKTIQELVNARNQDELVRRFDAPFEEIPYPTKLPGARLELMLDEGRSVSAFDLDMKRAIGTARFDRGEVTTFFGNGVTMLRVRGSAIVPRLVPPASLAKLGYAAATTGESATARWLVQQAALGLSYAVHVEWRAVKDHADIAVAIISSREGPDPLGIARARTRSALSRGFDALRSEHEAWWRQFWTASSVSIPDARIQQHYNLVQYFYGAASRRGAPPIPLQGVWTADAGTLPPWKGDFHFDLNVQLTYWAYLESGRFDAGLPYLDFMWHLVSAHRQFARDFFGANGIVVPGVMALDGQPLAGWGQYSLSPVQGAWVAQAFYLHWKYTADRAFLESRAYPYCALVGEGLASLLVPDARGHLKLPLSSSPEIHDNTLRAWMTPPTNYDLALLRWLFGALGEMAASVNRPTDAARWHAVVANLDELSVDPVSHVLKVSPDESLTESHRHLSHLMSIHPLGTLTLEGSEQERATLLASLDSLQSLGTKNWVGYSFAWAACAEARARRPDEAFRYLDTFVKAFVLRNGFHANGDQTRSGLSNFTYRPFTLEGNFAAGQAVHEMLMQSWGGTIRLFPAVPQSWRDASFGRLRAEGGLVVSAVRRDGAVIAVRIETAQDTTVRLADPRGACGNAPCPGELGWQIEERVRGGAARLRPASVAAGPGGTLECALKAGEALVGGRLKPGA